MPYSSTSELPSQTSKLPKKAKSIFLAAFNSSYGKDKDETKAFKIAWGAVRNAGFIQKNEEWVEVSKASVDYWMHRLKGTESHLGQLLHPEERKKILRAARAHAGGKAKAKKMKDMKEVVKHDMPVLDKDSVLYRVASGDMNCANCEHYESDNSTCDIVSGYIDPAATCNLWCPEEEMDEPDDSPEEEMGEMKVMKGDLTPGDVHMDMPMGSQKKKKRKMPMDAYAKSIRVSKMDEDQKIVYGVALEPYTIDSQGDWETPEDIEETAHNFMKMYRGMGVEHVEKNENIYPVQSYIAPADMIWELPDGSEELVKKGSWILGSKVEDDEVWDMVKSGELNGFSVEGSGEREDDEKEMPDLWYMDGNVSVEKRDISAKERAGYAESDFAGKGRSFPIYTQADVMAAFHSLGRAGSDNYSIDQIRRNIIRIARRKGFALPKSAQGDEKD